MSRSGALLLGLLIAFACRHALEDDEPELPPPASVEPTKEQTPRAGRRDSDVKRAGVARAEPVLRPEVVMRPEGPELIQRRLTALGFYAGRATRTIDDETTAALARFQVAKGLPETGAPDDETLRALGLDPEAIWR